MGDGSCRTVRLTSIDPTRAADYPEAHEAALEFLIPKNGPEFSDDPPKPLFRRRLNYFVRVGEGNTFSLPL